MASQGVPRTRSALLLAALLLLAGAPGFAVRALQVPAPVPAPAERPAGAWEHRILGTLDRIDPASATDTGGPLPFRQQLLLGALLAAATLVSEDLTCVAAGLLASHHKISLTVAIVSCLIGIFVGDLLLVLLGRLLGPRILERAPIRWVISRQTVERSERWFTAQGTKVVLASRFIPGSRLPLFLAAGILRAPFLRVAIALFLAGAVWTPILVGLSAWTGGAVLARFHSYERVVLPTVVAAVATVFLFTHLVVPLFSWRGRRMLLSRWRRLSRWEFWPGWLFQIPVVLHGLWLGLRHRNPTLFTAVNPGIPSGGFVEESKSAILRGLAGASGMPPGVTSGSPATPLHPESNRIAPYAVVPLSGGIAARLRQVETAIAEIGLALPVVLKPDVGERGRGVAVVRSAAELGDYLAHAAGDLIVQEYVAGEEFGVFYVRHPGAARGRIFSITGKRFPVVVGDGRRPLEELILADDRAVCMAPYYCAANLERLDEIPAAGERVQLVEIGNHCRGTVFLDARAHATPELAAAMDKIAGGFDGFFFGRFDLRVPSVEQFRAGTGMTILELNGVTSEATHIYAPGASLVVAYRTLFEQWRLAFEIGAANVGRGARATSLGGVLRLLRERRARFASIPAATASPPPPRHDPEQE